MDLQDPKTWTSNQVAQWLRQNGFEDYAEQIAFKHKIDGAGLLQLREHDFREKPLKMDCLGDIKRITTAIDGLRRGLVSTSGTTTGNLKNKYGHPDGRRFNINTDDQLLVCVGYADKVLPLANCDPKILQQNLPPAIIEDLATQMVDDSKYESHLQLMSRDALDQTLIESPQTESRPFLKLIVALLYFWLSVVITAIVMVFVHDRVPDMKAYPPLPDIVLDNVPLIPWAFQCCELIGMTLACIAVTVAVFHKHRILIARRLFSLIGSVFLLRCITMLITSMSVPGIHLECKARKYNSLSEKLHQAYIIYSGAGMSVQGVRTCGDYMFSGHTSVLTLLNYFITEYTPETWTTLHTSTWTMNAFGVFFILAAHEHYSIDVFIAFYISSRMFMYCHSYAYNRPCLITTAANSTRIKLWFPLSWFFEAGGAGRVENEFEIPIGYPDVDWWRTQIGWTNTPASEDPPQHTDHDTNSSYDRSVSADDIMGSTRKRTFDAK